MLYPIKTSFGKANIQALQICKELGNLVPPAGEDLVFDFTGYGENNPFSNLILINALRHLKKNNPDARLRGMPKSSDHYLSYIGFYKSIGIQYGKDPGEAFSTPNFVPITLIPLLGMDFYRIIDEKANQLAGTLQFDRGLQELLAYIFVETIRNVYEHANTDRVFVAAQKWPTLGLVEIAISDDGCGVSGSLGKYFSTDPINLLRLACKPGVSARSNYRYLEKEDPWRNSGYGLYIMKELSLAYGGSFILCSGDNAIRFYTDNLGLSVEETFQTTYKGTAIGLRFRTNTENNFEKTRRRIVSEGELRAAQIKGAIRSASKSSGGRYRMH